MAIPNWMTKTWHITTTNESGVAVSDSVSFDTTTAPSTITIMVQGMPWGSLDPNSIAATDTSAAGSTSPSANPPGQPFHIDCDGTALSCYLDDASYSRHFFPRRRWLAAGLGAGVGTLLGAAVGLAFRSPLVGTLAGLAAAVSSPATARIVDESGAGGGSSTVWTAGDPTGRISKPGRHSVVRATA